MKKAKRWIRNNEKNDDFELNDDDENTKNAKDSNNETLIKKRWKFVDIDVFDCVIFDEIQKTKIVRSLITKIILFLKASRKLFLNIIFMINKTFDLYDFLRILWNDNFHISFNRNSFNFALYDEVKLKLIEHELFRKQFEQCHWILNLYAFKSTIKFSQTSETIDFEIINRILSIILKIYSLIRIFVSIVKNVNEIDQRINYDVFHQIWVNVEIEMKTFQETLYEQFYDSSMKLFDDEYDN